MNNEKMLFEIWPSQSVCFSLVFSFVYFSFQPHASCRCLVWSWCLWSVFFVSNVVMSSVITLVFSGPETTQRRNAARVSIRPTAPSLLRTNALFCSWVWWFSQSYAVVHIVLIIPSFIYVPCLVIGGNTEHIWLCWLCGRSLVTRGNHSVGWPPFNRRNNRGRISRTRIGVGRWVTS